MEWHKTRKQFMYELYDDVLNKDKNIKDGGYNLVIMLENEFKTVQI